MSQVDTSAWQYNSLAPLHLDQYFQKKKNGWVQIYSSSYLFVGSYPIHKKLKGRILYKKILIFSEIPKQAMDKPSTTQKNLLLTIEWRLLEIEW